MLRFSNVYIPTIHFVLTDMYVSQAEDKMKIPEDVPQSLSQSKCLRVPLSRYVLVSFYWQ